MRWATVASVARKARAISSVVSPPISRSVRAARACGEQERMAGDEEQAEELVAEVVVERRLDPGRAGVGLLELAADLGVLQGAHPVAAETVDRPAAGRRHQPGAGVARHAGLRPFGERDDEGVLRQLLGDGRRRARGG